MIPDQVKRNIIANFIRDVLSRNTNPDVETFLSNELDNILAYLGRTENEIVIAGYMHPNTFESLKGVPPTLKRDSLVKHDNYLNLFVSPDYLSYRARELDRYDLDIEQLVRENSNAFSIENYYDLAEAIDDFIYENSIDSTELDDEDEDDEDYVSPF